MKSIMSRQTDSHGCEAGLTFSVSPTAKVITSNPTSPDTASSSTLGGFPLILERLKLSPIETPARPKSTPFLWQETPSCEYAPRSPNGSDQVHIALRSMDEMQRGENVSASKLTFSRLPTEIHELILDHLFGTRTSTAKTMLSSRGWNTAMRHSRRRQLSDVALISKSYQELVQGRLFKHIKIQGTRPSINEAIVFFSDHIHLQKHTRHIEIWSPVWERRAGPANAHVIIPPTTPERTTLVRVMNAHVAGFEPSSNVASAYQLASRNSSLYEIFTFIDLMFHEACVLTLEGGHCRKPTMIRHFPEVHEGAERQLPSLTKIRTLILKSAWNIMRTEEDFNTIMTALPNLKEWHSSYAKPKSKSYLNISAVVPKLPSSIRHLNVSLECTYSREALSPRFWRKIYPSKTHICHQLAQALPQLESFAYSGRICHHFFQGIGHLMDSDRRENMKLKSLDLTVKNCCRPMFMDGSGISDPGFIVALENLVVAGVNSLRHLKSLSWLRIRFIDLESPMPLLNPYFQMKDDCCTGLWSEKILIALAASRPAASFTELSDTFGGLSYDKEGKIIPGEKTSRTRPISMKVSSYEAFSTVIAIN